MEYGSNSIPDLEEKSHLRQTLETIEYAIKESWHNDIDATAQLTELISIQTNILSSTSFQSYFPSENDFQYFITRFTEETITNILREHPVPGKDGDDIALTVLTNYILFYTKFYNDQQLILLWSKVKFIFNQSANYFSQGNGHQYGNLIHNPKRDITVEQFNTGIPHIKNEFKVGDRCDIYICNYHDKNEIGKHNFLRGSIVNVDNNSYTVKTDIFPQEITRDKESCFVFNEGVLTHDWEWRLGLKEYDVVDCYHNGRYRPAMVLSVEDVRDDDNEQLLSSTTTTTTYYSKRCYKIGCRILIDKCSNYKSYAKYYDNGDNIRTDYLQNKYIGESFQFDSDYDFYDLRIQKPNTKLKDTKTSQQQQHSSSSSSLHYMNANPYFNRGGYTNNTLFPSINTEDEDNIIQSINDNYYIYINEDGSKNYIIGKQRDFSYYYTSLLQLFAKHNGYEDIISILTSDKISNENIYLVFYILNISLPYLHKTYLLDNYTTITQSALKYIDNLSSNEIRNLKKEISDIIIEVISKIQFRLCINNNSNNNTSNNSFNIVDEFTMKIIIKMINSSIFDKRLHGVKLLNDYLKSNKDNDVIVTSVLQLMKHNNIIQEIFGVNSHSQIIAKSTDIIAVILERNFLSPDELMLILSGTQKGDLDGKLTILNILKELSHLFSHEQRQTILCFVYEHVDTSNIKEKEIELICNLSQSSNNNDDVVNAIDFFMGCILKCKVHGDKMNNLLIEKLKDITKIKREYMVQVFMMCAKALKDNVNAVMAYKILFSFIHKIIHSCTTSNSSEHNVIQQAYNDYFKDDNDLLKLYKANCVLYKSQAKHIINNDSNRNTSSKLIVDGFTHSDNISIRLAFITLFTKRSEFNIIDFLIQLLYIDPVCESDRNDFFKFTEKIFDNTNTISLDKSHYIPIINELFKLFSNAELFTINNITSTSLEVFCITFLYINIQNRNIIINHDQPRSPFTTSTDNEIEHILKHSTLQVRPDELNGFDILWSIIFTSNDDAIASDALKLLQDLYNKNNQSNLLLAKCTDAIKHSSTYDNAFNKYFNIMNKLFIESESNGVPTIRAHCDILKERLFTLKLIYMGATPNETVTVYKNTTLSELKLAIARHNTCDYDDITLEHNSEVIPPNRHCVPLCKILSLSDNDNELIVKLTTEHKYVDLLDRSGFATAKFESVLNEWFDTFSEDNERMTAEKIRDFTEKVTKVVPTQYTKSVSVDDERVRGLLDRYDHDGKGYITREDFMHFYITAAKDKCSLVWNNILSMGYRENLMKKDEEVEVDVTEKEVYPRYVLGNDKEFLGIVFEVFKNAGDDIDKRMKLLEFVNSLCTNEEMYKEMLMNMNKEYTVFDNGNEVVDLYKMHIVESFVEDVKCEEAQTDVDVDVDMIVKWYDVVDVNVNECKCKWIDVFYESGQFVKLIAYVCGLLHRLSSEIYVESSRIVVMCLNKAVKLLFTFFTLTLNNNNSNNVAIHNNEYMNITEQHLLQLVKELISFIMNTLNNTVNAKTNEHVDIYTCFTLCISLLVHKPTLFEHIINSNNSNNGIDNISYQLLHDLITICLMSTQPQHCVFFIKTLIQYTSIANDIAHHNIVFYLYSICLHLFKRILHSNNTNTTTTTTNTNTTSFTLFFDYFTSLYEIICVLRSNLPSNVVDAYITRYNIGSDEFIMNLYDSVIDYVLCNNKQNQMIITGDLFIGVVKLLIKGIQNNPLTKTALLSKQRNNINIFNELIKFVIPSNDDTPTTTATTNDNTVHPPSQTNQYIPLHSITTATTAEVSLLNQKSHICKFITALIDGNASYSAEYFINNAHHLSELLTSLDNSSSLPQPHETLSTYYKELMYNQPDTPRGRSEGYVGLKNLGCICYMNSIMQQLYMVPTFRYAILQSDDHKPIETSSSFDDNLLHQLQRMYTFLLLSEKEYYNPKLFCLAYRDIDGNPTNVVVQQDSQEFLNAFCDKIEAHLKETEFKYIINDVFCGRTCSQVICDTCLHVSHRFEDFYDLTLEVKNINNLNESLDKMVAPEKIDDFNCERCKNKVTITKRTTLATLPNVLIVHLRRFWMNYDEFHTEKINSTFKFPFEINLKKYCIEDITQNATNATVYDSDDIYYKEDEYYMYTLKGVTVHMGTADGGHYFSYINVNRDNTASTSSSGDTWLKFNDSHVSKFDVKDLPDECFGGSSSRENNNGAYGHHHGMMMMHEVENCQNAYLLIYERKAKTPIRYVYTPQTQFNTVNVNVVMFDEKTRNAVLKQHDISRKQSQSSRNELTHALTYKVFHDVQKNEHYVYRGYYSLDKKVPLEYYKQVQQTNKQFLRKCNKDKSFHELIKHIERDFKAHVQQHPEMIVQLDSNVKTTLCDVVLNKLFMLLSSNNCDDSSSDNVMSVLNDLNVYFEVLTWLIEGNEGNMMKFFAFLEMNSRFGLLATLDKTYMAFIEQLCLFMENVLEKNISTEQCTYAHEVIKLTLSLFTSGNMNNTTISASTQVVLLPPFYSLLHKVLKHIDNAKYEEMQTHFNIISFLAKSLVCMYNEVESNINNINTEQQQQQQCNKYTQCCNIIIECLFNFLMRLQEYNSIQYIPQQYKLNTTNNNSNNSSDNLYIHLNDITSILTKLETDAFLHALSHLNIPHYANILYFLYCSNRNIIQPETTRILKQIHQHIHNTTYITQLYTILITLLSIKDSKTPEKFICILGYPEINIEYINSSERIWPLFGYELYKRDDKSMYRYVTPNHVDKEYSLLQFFNNEFNYEMYMKLLTVTTEHFGLFKYLYLTPSNAMRFNNYYEEMVMKCEAYVRNVSDDEVKAKMVDDIEEIKKRNKAYEERVVNYIKSESDVHEECYELPGWKGYLTEMIPKDIVNENIRKLAEGEGLLFYLFEYETTFIEVDLLKPSEALLHELEKEMNNNNNNNNDNTTGNDEDNDIQLQLQQPTEEGIFSTKIQKPYPKQNPLIFNVSYRGYNEKRFITQLTSSTKYTNNLLLTFTNPLSSPSNTRLIRISRFTIINNTSKKGTITFLNKVHTSTSSTPLNYFIPNIVTDLLTPNDYRDCFIIHSFHKHLKHFIHSDTSWSIKLNIDQPSYSSYSPY